MYGRRWPSHKVPVVGGFSSERCNIPDGTRLDLDTGTTTSILYSTPYKYFHKPMPCTQTHTPCNFFTPTTNRPIRSRAGRSRKTRPTSEVSCTRRGPGTPPARGAPRPQSRATAGSTAAPSMPSRGRRWSGAATWWRTWRWRDLLCE